MTDQIKRGEVWLANLNPDGGLAQDSVTLCFQIRVLDKIRLIRKLGQLNSETIIQLEEVVLLTLGYEL